jgi:hypothetical protein
MALLCFFQVSVVMDALMKPLATSGICNSPIQALWRVSSELYLSKVDGQVLPLPVTAMVRDLQGW